MKPDPLVIAWRGRRSACATMTRTSGRTRGRGQQLRAAIELASDVEGLRLVLASTVADALPGQGERRRERVSGCDARKEAPEPIRSGASGKPRKACFQGFRSDATPLSCLYAFLLFVRQCVAHTVGEGPGRGLQDGAPLEPNEAPCRAGALPLPGWTDERPTDDEMDALVAELRDAGILTIGRDASGAETWTLTPMGASLARQLAMSSEDDAFELLNALLDAAEAGTPTG